MVLAPIAVKPGVDPTHVAMIAISNLALGTITPAVDGLRCRTCNLSKVRMSAQVRELAPVLWRTRGAGAADLRAGDRHLAAASLRIPPAGRVRDGAAGGILLFISTGSWRPRPPHHGEPP
ncbi:hypothetical protein [Xylophilus ampelinus]|uniref:Uncharacterized protein n=1 Tax=Xylophilus ampelinus TaxID=54067 RepID=A0A318SXZ0_9BURK|nr:hypothetical protein [Xylophilus ampelinus]MCS4509076.1 hypothetical protein [Xylophilus ampelinus]PYE79897.1 hypothetical protein DFQ15_101218 [Xylophilus ampelinus]